MKITRATSGPYRDRIHYTTDDHRFMCKEEDFKRSAYDGKWWEYQANLAMSSLLLPKALTITALATHCTTTPLGGTTITDIDTAARAISDTFDVNPLAAKIRIKQLFNL